MKNILYMAISIDGKITGKDADTSWVEDSDVERMDSLMEECGVMVMGSKTYGSFGDELPSDKALQVIFTKNKQLLEKKQDNVRFTSEDPQKVLESLHNEGFTNILIAGGGELNTSLIKENLIDEIRVIVKPLVMGNGKSLFNSLDERKIFKLVNSEILSYGAVELTFVKA